MKIEVNRNLIVWFIDSTNYYPFTFRWPILSLTVLDWMISCDFPIIVMIIFITVDWSRHRMSIRLTRDMCCPPLCRTVGTPIVTHGIVYGRVFIKCTLTWYFVYDGSRDKISILLSSVSSNLNEFWSFDYLPSLPVNWALEWDN